MFTAPHWVRTSIYGVSALKLPYLLFLEKKKNSTPPPRKKYPSATGAREWGAAWRRKVKFRPGFPFWRRGTRRGAPRSPCARSASLDIRCGSMEVTVRGFIKWGRRNSWILTLRIPRSAEFMRNDIPIVYLSGSSSEGGSFCYDTPFCIFHGHDIMAISFPTFQQTFKLQSICITYKVTP